MSSTRGGTLLLPFVWLPGPEPQQPGKVWRSGIFTEASEEDARPVTQRPLIGFFDAPSSSCSSSSGVVLFTKLDCRMQLSEFEETALLSNFREGLEEQHIHWSQRGRWLGLTVDAHSPVSSMPRVPAAAARRLAGCGVVLPCSMHLSEKSYFVGTKE